MAATTSLMRLDDDILLLLLDELSAVGMWDMVSLALTSRRIHFLAHKHLSEHQYLLRFRKPCLDYKCTHEQGCTFIAKHPADMLEVCQPGSKVFDYIKCVSIGFTNNYSRGHGYPDSLLFEGMRKAKSTAYLQDMFAEIVDHSEAKLFWREMRLEKLFLWRLMRPVAIQMSSVNDFRGHVERFGEVFRLFGL